MSDYTPIVDFTAKDALSTGDPNKLAKGTEIDGELDAINTAVATKYDSNDLASEVEAEALTLNTKIITPLRLDNVFKDNRAVLNMLHDYADPGADTIFGWDDSATGAEVIGFTMGNGLEFSTTTVQLASSLAGDLLDYSSGVLSLTNVTAGANNPMNLSGTAWTCDITALGAVVGSSLAATDTFMVDYGGVASKIEHQDVAMRVRTGADAGTTSQTATVADMNSIMVFTGTATLTLPNSSLTLGAPIVVKNTHASQLVTIALAASATLNSVNHSTATSVTDTVNAGGTALIYQTASGAWHLTGDITD